MGSLRRSKSKQPEEAQCRRHPKHRQSPGVCSVCLGEKLSSLYSSGSGSGSARNADPDPDMGSSCCSSASSYSSYYSSSSSSSCSTPARGEEEDRRWKGPSSMSFLFSGIGKKKKTKNSGLIKSRSMDLVEKMRGEKIGNDGFWSKLLQVQSRSGSKSRGSVTLREEVVVTG